MEEQHTTTVPPSLPHLPRAPRMAKDRRPLRHPSSSSSSSSTTTAAAAAAADAAADRRLEGRQELLLQQLLVVVLLPLPFLPPALPPSLHKGKGGRAHQQGRNLAIRVLLRPREGTRVGGREGGRLLLLLLVPVQGEVAVIVGEKTVSAAVGKAERRGAIRREGGREGGREEGFS